MVPCPPPPRGAPGRVGTTANDVSVGGRRRHVLPPIRTFTVGPGVPPGQPHIVRRAGRGLSPPARNFTDPGARVAPSNVTQPARWAKPPTGRVQPVRQLLLDGGGARARAGAGGAGARARAPAELGLRLALAALVVAPRLHPVAAHGHRAPLGAVGVAAVDEEQPALGVAARAQPAGPGL